MSDKHIMGAHRRPVSAGGSELSDVQAAKTPDQTSGVWTRFKQTSFARWVSGKWSALWSSLSARKAQPVAAPAVKVTTKAEEVEAAIDVFAKWMAAPQDGKPTANSSIGAEYSKLNTIFRRYYLPQGGDLNDVKVTVGGKETTLARLGADLLTPGKDPVVIAGQIVEAMRTLIAARETPAPAAPAATPRAVDRPEYDWLKQERGILPKTFTTIYLVQVLKGEATLRKNVVDLGTKTDEGSKVVLQATHQHVAQELVRRAYKAYEEGKLQEMCADGTRMLSLLKDAADAADSADRFKAAEKAPEVFADLARVMQSAGVI